MTTFSSPTLAVTTSVRPDDALEAEARAVGEALQAAYVPRGNGSLAETFARSGAGLLLVVGADRLRLWDRATGAEYFYHPNLFLTRGSQFLARRHHAGTDGGEAGGAETDPFLRAARLGPGDSLLDCTLGFASEAALAALAVGAAGRVVGLESAPALAYVTKRGVQTFPLQNKTLEAALRRVTVEDADAGDYLAGCRDGAFDVVYFDPFFPERLAGSEASVSPLFVFGDPSPLNEAAVHQACRVARHRVVLKHPRAHPLPGAVAALVTEAVANPKSRLVYSILPAT